MHTWVSFQVSVLELYIWELSHLTSCYFGVIRLCTRTNRDLDFRFSVLNVSLFLFWWMNLTCTFFVVVYFLKMCSRLCVSVYDGWWCDTVSVWKITCELMALWFWRGKTHAHTHTHLNTLLEGAVACLCLLSLVVVVPGEEICYSVSAPPPPIDQPFLRPSPATTPPSASKPQINGRQNSVPLTVPRGADPPRLIIKVKE